MPNSAIERLDQLYDRPGFLLRRAHQIFVSILEAEFASIGLSPAQYAVLIALHEKKKLTQGELALSLGMNKVSISQVVQGLERNGWLLRQVDSVDKRQLRLTLTAAGRNMLRRTRGMAETTYNAQMAPLNDDEREQFVSLLKRLVHELEPHARAAFNPLDVTKK
ncbi:HTH marR-type domain-containing protein [Bordetella tumbae]|uniref:MarR family winged helix-turn-helix transcriptional regulator n=1 Tax=Bordetella tumbae TaxID=1649139 RepID=UPI0039EEAE6C